MPNRPNDVELKEIYNIRRLTGLALNFKAKADDDGWTRPDHKQFETIYIGHVCTAKFHLPVIIFLPTGIVQPGSFPKYKIQIESGQMLFGQGSPY